MAPLCLRCAIVGERSVFTMQVDSKWSVGILLTEIGKARRLCYPGILLRVYITQPLGDSRSAWLHTSDLDYQALTVGDPLMKAAYVNEGTELNKLYRLALHFPTQPDERAQAIHVLIKYPTYDEVFKYWSWGSPDRIAAIDRSQLDSVDTTAAEPLYDRIVGPLRMSARSLAAWVTLRQPEVHKTKAA